MNKHPASIARITPPRLSAVVQRERLFCLLDKCTEKSVVWITASAGSGKSTLVASWLDSRKLPSLWLQLDAGDKDPATFFYYLGLAAQKTAPRPTKPLPLLTPEYLPSLSIFTRRFFEELCSHLNGLNQCILVFDNYQEVPADSVLHDLLQQGFDVLPEGATAIVISRVGPGSQFARLRANGRMAIVGWNELRFTRDEVKDAVKPWRKGHCMERDCPGPDALFQKTDGWAAGLRLMIEAVEPQRSIVRSTPPGDPVCHCVESLAWKDNVFSYFACEVMNRTARSICDFLIATSFLPFMTTGITAKLTGRKDAAEILSDLSRRNFFTDWHPGRVPVYQYHLLFREFLQEQAQNRYDAAERHRIQRTGAELLEEAGFIEEAVALFSELGDYNRAVPLITRLARPLLSQGRNKTVEGLLAALPKTTVASDPGLLHLAGLCCMAFDPGAARGFLASSFRLLQERQECAAAIPVCGGIIETILYEADNFQDLDPYIEWLDNLAAERDAPVLEALKKISGSVLFALAYRDPGHRTLPIWHERAEEALTAATGAMETLKLRNHLMAYYLFRGEFGRFSRLLRAMLQQNKAAAAVPMIALHGILHEAFHAVFAQGDTEAGIALARTGLERAEETGVRVYDFWFAYLLVSASLITGDVQAAETFLPRMSDHGTTAPRKRAADLQSLAGHVAFEKGDWTGAAEDFRAALDLAMRVGDRFSTVWYRISLAQTWYRSGDGQRAREILAEVAGENWAHSLMYHYQGLLTSAVIDLGEGAEDRGLGILREGLALGRKYALMLAPFWNRKMTASLLARALAAGIETEFVRQVIKKHRLQPPPGEPVTDAWPWPVRIYTLGRFQIFRDDVLMDFSGKAPQKPLELLKTLIAFGGRDVAEERLTDSLWPDADGDLAHQSFEKNLSRLRKLLGGSDRLTLGDHQLSLDPQCCWVDSIAFDATARAIETVPEGHIVRIYKEAVGLYQGHFLPADAGREWAVSGSEALKNRMLRISSDAGRWHEQQGQWESAVACYQKGLETDCLAEEFYRRLMNCYQKLGRRGDAVRLYNRCVSLFQTKLGMGPSPETEALYSSIIQKTRHS